MVLPNHIVWRSTPCERLNGTLLFWHGADPPGALIQASLRKPLATQAYSGVKLRRQVWLIAIAIVVFLWGDSAYWILLLRGASCFLASYVLVYFGWAASGAEKVDPLSWTLGRRGDWRRFGGLSSLSHCLTRPRLIKFAFGPLAV